MKRFVCFSRYKTHDSTGKVLALGSFSIFLLVQYNWDERKCPKKGTPEFDKEILERFGNGSEGTGKSGSKSGKGRRANAKQSTAAAAAKAASRAADAVTTSTAAAKKQKSDKAATPSALARVSGPIRHIADAVNGTADKIKEVPQVLGQLISHALPSSSRKQSSDRPAISTGTNAAAQPLTDAAQKAQQAITAMSPAGASGTGKRASGTKQDAPPAKRVSRHATFAGPASAVVLDDQDEDIDIGGEAPHPHKVTAAHASLVGCWICWNVLLARKVVCERRCCGMWVYEYELVLSCCQYRHDRKLTLWQFLFDDRYIFN